MSLCCFAFVMYMCVLKGACFLCLFVVCWCACCCVCVCYFMFVCVCVVCFFCVVRFPVYTVLGYDCCSMYFSLGGHVFVSCVFVFWVLLLLWL